ncbi:hypothetical protein GR183_03780 [Stappia sp. GBMRC 2046]|uniref:V/A-type H+-transporting ATPase subunit E n=1 Tax=Stappia sediminis TaxID=2692190 RepID=A0A7X3LS06_9HYPH|nr:hypothetical protein [Stappia sediminis]MXN64015.1 hypothetical protein [Stappia sediminis]
MAKTPEINGAHTGAGVQALIERLKTEGIAAGQDEADRILTAARAKADKLVADAEAKAKEIVDKAKSEAAAETAAANDALKIAARDLVLRLRNELGNRIGEETRRLLGDAFTDEEFLKNLILAIAGKAKKDAGITAKDAMEIVLPSRIVTFDELKKSPEAAEEGTLTHFVVTVAADVLRKGVSFNSAPGFEGIKIRLVDRDLSIDLTEEAIAALLTQHLQPRFRALMEGVVR